MCHLYVIRPTFSRSLRPNAPHLCLCTHLHLPPSAPAMRALHCAALRSDFSGFVVRLTPLELHFRRRNCLFWSFNFIFVIWHSITITVYIQIKSMRYEDTVRSVDHYSGHNLCRVQTHWFLLFLFCYDGNHVTTTCFSSSFSPRLSHASFAFVLWPALRRCVCVAAHRAAALVFGDIQNCACTEWSLAKSGKQRNTCKISCSCSQCSVICMIDANLKSFDCYFRGDGRLLFLVSSMHRFESNRACNLNAWLFLFLSIV